MSSRPSSRRPGSTSSRPRSGRSYASVRKFSILRTTSLQNLPSIEQFQAPAPPPPATSCAVCPPRARRAGRARPSRWRGAMRQRSRRRGRRRRRRRRRSQQVIENNSWEPVPCKQAPLTSLRTLHLECPTSIVIDVALDLQIK